MAFRRGRAILMVVLGAVALIAAGCPGGGEAEISNTPDSEDVLGLWVRTHEQEVDAISNALSATERSEAMSNGRPRPVWAVSGAEDLVAACDRVRAALAGRDWVAAPPCDGDPTLETQRAVTRSTSASGRSFSDEVEFEVSLSMAVAASDGGFITWLTVDDFRPTS